MLFCLVVVVLFRCDNFCVYSSRLLRIAAAALSTNFAQRARNLHSPSTQAPTFSQSTLPLPLPLPSLLPLLSRFSASTVLNLRSLACAFGSGFCRPHFPVPPSLLLLLASTHTRSPVFTLLALVCPTLPAVAYLHSISASPLSAANC